MKKNILPSSVLIILTLLLLFGSFIGFLWPIYNVVITLVILIGIFIAGIIRFEFIALALLLELSIGGQGYLFSITLFGYPLSLRILLFGLAFFLFLFHAVRKKKFPKIVHSSYGLPFVIFLAFIFWGIVNGYRGNDPQLVFFDANAYISIFYCMFFVEAFQTDISRTRAVRTLLSAGVALAVATIFFLGTYAIFHFDTSLKSAISVDQTEWEKITNQEVSRSLVVGQKVGPSGNSLLLHSEDVTKTKPATYRWLRDTGTAEISYISGRFFRVFFSSHIILLFSFFIFASLFWKTNNSITRKKIFAALIIVSLALLVSYSRSIWLGWSFGLLLFFIIWYRSTIHKAKILFLLFVIGIIFVTFLFTTSIGAGLVDRVEGVFFPQTDVSASHRITLGKALLSQIQNHPLLGTGFGTKISFPTILANGEVIETGFYIFEWSYLDVAVKIGVAGLLAFFLLLLKVFYELIKRYKEILTPTIFLGVALGLVALTIGNITTPIFTHPLGLSMLGLAMAFSLKPYERTITDSHVE